MTDSNTTQQSKTSDVDLDDLVASTDTGARNPEGGLGKFLAAVAFIWSLFHIYLASSMPYIMVDLTGIQFFVDVLTVGRQIHLAFALFLAAMAYPLFAGSSRRTIPWYDWILGIVGAVSCLYMFYFQEELAARAGLPTTADIVIASCGLAVLLIATYRALGFPLLIVAGFFLTYGFFVNKDFIPEVIQWKGASYSKAMGHFWITEEGVFGIALSVSASLVFLFVLFGSLLDKAGAGNWFIKIAFALMGHLRGGPAKAAVVSSAMTGLISGSSIANTVTTGTFTIPLMKRVGFKPEPAAAVEVASSVNGQIMPPVMGAAAFLMVEFIGITYLEVVKHAFLPATISYIALLYIVHLEALKSGMQGLPRRGVAKPFLQKIIGVLTGFIGVAALSAAMHYGLGWTKDAFGENTIYIVGVLFVAIYIALLKVAAGYPDLELDDPNAPVTELPELKSTAMAGYYYLLPIVTLIWCLIIERLSPSLSAFWATIGLLFIIFTQHPLKAMFRNAGTVNEEFRRGVAEFTDGMIAGARNMIGIGVATGAAGIVVGTISLTAFHFVVGDFIEFLSGGSLIIMLILVAIFSLILGMGLPTTANYIVVSSLMAFVVVDVGAQNGLIVPLIAVHLFVFYFGIMADVTPPVGLASFAGAAISGGDPLKTGFTASYYSLRTVALPFLFIFNTDLLLIDVTWLEAIFVFIIATVAMMIFAAATQGYFFAKCKAWEIVAMLLVAFTLFRPGFWLDMVASPYETLPPAQVFEAAESTPSGENLRIIFEFENFDTGDLDRKTFEIPIEGEGSGQERLQSKGIELLADGDRMVVDNVGFGSWAEEQKIDFDWTIVSVDKAADRVAKEVFYIPALVLLGLIIMLQRRRTDVPAF